MEYRTVIDKSSLRLNCKTRRAQLSPESRLNSAAAVSRLFLEHFSPDTLRGQTVAGYFPIGEELDILPLLHKLLTAKITCALPLVNPPSKQLLFKEWLGETVIGAYGIAVPPPENATIMPDIILVPLVGFNRELHRIGYGAGYYDTTLNTLRESSHPPFTVGIAFNAQEAPDFKADSHDASLDMIITEQGILT